MSLKIILKGKQNVMDYLNNAGAGLISSDTYSAITEYLQLEGKLGAYQAANESKNIIDKFYANVAALINASPSEISFIDSASRGMNLAIYGAKITKNDRIVTLSSEYGTNLIMLFDFANKVGATLRVIQCDISGNFSLEEIESELKNGARMVAISHVTAHGSIVNLVKEIGMLTKKYNAIYIVDGCQSVGQITVDVQSINCDAYITTGRKWLRGPRGTGFMYINNSAPIETTQLSFSSADLVLDNELNIKGLEIRPTAKRFEFWEKSIANLLGFSSAINEYLNLDKNFAHNKIKSMSNMLRNSAVENTNINIIGCSNSDSGILGFYLNDYTKENLVRDTFSKENIIISNMNNRDCPLHFPKNGAKTIFRLSPHYYTEESTILKACKVISEI